MSNKEVLEIVRGISSAAAQGYDGALDSDGQPLKIGLKREEGDPILDKRIIDGFKASIAGNMLIIKYQAEIMLKDVYKGDFEGEVEQRMKDISSFLKKEYKKITGNSLTLTKDDEAEILVQSISKVRSVVNATQKFKIGGIPDEPELGATPEERLSTAIKDWIGFGKDKFSNTKNPSNVKGKRDEEPRS